MRELKKEEGQWSWKLHKESRQLDVDKEKLQAQKLDVLLASKKINRKQVALSKGCRTLERREAALGTISAKLVADKKVSPLTDTTLPLYSLAFPNCFASTPTYASYS